MMPDRTSTGEQTVPIAKIGVLPGDFKRRGGGAAPKMTAPHPTRYARKPISTRPTVAEVLLAVLSFSHAASHLTGLLEPRP